MPRNTIALLVTSSVLNAAFSFFMFVFALFSTSPMMEDVAMRLGFYVLNGVGAAAVAAVFLPWILVHRQHARSAVFFALLPLALLALSVVAFLTLDSWLGRTFS